jgi:DNA polymerase III psi subunit
VSRRTKVLSRNKCYNFEVNMVSHLPCEEKAWKWLYGNGLPM